MNLIIRGTKSKESFFKIFTRCILGFFVFPRRIVCVYFENFKLKKETDRDSDVVNRRKYITFLDNWVLWENV